MKNASLDYGPEEVGSLLADHSLPDFSEVELEARRALRVDHQLTVHLHTHTHRERLYNIQTTLLLGRAFRVHILPL